MRDLVTRQGGVLGLLASPVCQHHHRLLTVTGSSETCVWSKRQRFEPANRIPGSMQANMPH